MPELLNRELTPRAYLPMPRPALVTPRPALSPYRSALRALLIVEHLLVEDVLGEVSPKGCHGVLILLGDADPALRLSVAAPLVGGD